ncbi:hypothetical protein SAMN05216377_101268 [Pseudonocardia oroxyli]|uniref:Uncharacterized protein n=1 Tax=Pseudonocardia oroxyli TaxID=366584 RepID=A0A1G7E6B0_PSEOR|nr:hypothetical protein SAMN05216377_101268 [Pseudonocardia oroxyli]
MNATVVPPRPGVRTGLAVLLLAVWGHRAVR